jgi:hypothetical protein
MGKKLGIIQSRGLGDIIIGLPIANYYRQQGWEVLWPVTSHWVEQLSHNVPWVKWIPVEQDPGPFFYDEPLKRLKNFKCDEIIPLYQALTGQDFHKEPYFQHTSFDQYKYIRADVPFLEKWRLSECITRDADREQALYDRKVGTKPYVVTHLDASGGRTEWDSSMVPEGWDIIDITSEGYIFDWLKIIEGAESIIMTDSCMANLVDQLNIGEDRYFIPIHHIGLTPVQGNHWTWIPNPRLDGKSQMFGIQ